MNLQMMSILVLIFIRFHVPGPNRRLPFVDLWNFVQTSWPRRKRDHSRFVGVATDASLSLTMLIAEHLPNCYYFLSGITAAKYLKKSGLKESLLHRIWSLSDYDTSGTLDKKGIIFPREKNVAYRWSFFCFALLGIFLCFARDCLLLCSRLNLARSAGFFVALKLIACAQNDIAFDIDSLDEVLVKELTPPIFETETVKPKPAGKSCNSLTH